MSQHIVLTDLFTMTLLLHMSLGAPSSNIRSSDPAYYEHLQDNGLLIPLGEADTMQNDVLGDPLSPEDYKLGNTLVEDVADPPVHAIDPIEFAGLYEGDISITAEDQDMIRKGKKMPTSRAASVDSLKKKWPNGVVPYVLSSKYSNPERAIIAKAFSTIQNDTCIRFVPRSNEPEYIHILQGDGCFSGVGRKGDGQGQVLSLGLLCITVPMIMHELLHALGFWHEQSRYDRDDYVTVMWDNIMPGMQKNFDIIPWDTLGIPYDAKSLMHYKPYTFSKNRKVPNGNPTLISKTDREMGQRRNLEKSDIEKIIVYYQCDNMKFKGTHEVTSITTPDSGSCVDEDQYCLMWKQENECVKNPPYMQMFCRKSCGLCIDPNSSVDPNACEDHNSHCEAWSHDYQCLVNPGYMDIYCRKSCGKCQMSNGLFK